MKSRQRTQEELVDDWNRQYPGTDVDIIWHKTIQPNRHPVRDRTRSPAWLLGGHTAVILVTSKSGCVALEGIVAVPATTLCKSTK